MMTGPEKALRRLLLGVTAAVFLFQLFTLQVATLNGDESIYMLILEELARVRSGNLPQLNPLIGYTGLLDMWTIGSVFALAGPLGIEPSAWMLRIIPFLFFWGGTFLLIRELRRHSDSLTPWYLFFAALLPLAAVFSRVAMPHSLLMGTSGFLLAEALRARRTGRIRWLPIALGAGVSTHFHTTAFIGLPVVLAPALPLLWQQIRARPGHTLARVAGSLVLFLVLAYPLLRHFPPPTDATHERGTKFLFELRSLANIVTGYQPFQFALHREAAPNALLVGFLSLVVFVLGRTIPSWLRDPGTWPRTLRVVFISHVLASAFLVVMAFRGRSLTMVGHERYLMVLVPGWTLLWADAFQRLASRLRPRAALALMAGLALFLGLRLVIPVAGYLRETDTSLLAARWLMHECPKGSCVAYAENFWSYWNIRFYSRDALDLNFHDYNWKEVPFHRHEGKKLAGCWFYDSPEDLETSKTMYRGPAESRIEFPPQAAARGQVCFSGIQLEEPRR